MFLHPARHVRRPVDECPALAVKRLRGRRTTPQATTDGERTSVCSQGHLDGGRFFGGAAAPGDGLVGEARSAAAGAEESPEDALEEGGFAGPVHAHDADGTLWWIQLQGVPQLLVVLYEEAFEDHAALPSGAPGSSFAALVRYARPFSRNSSAKAVSSSPRSLRSLTKVANSSPSGPKTAVWVPFLSKSSGFSSAWISREKFRQRRCRSRSSSRSMPLATPWRTS